jgi:hypothetical protein
MSERHEISGNSDSFSGNSMANGYYMTRRSAELGLAAHHEANSHPVVVIILNAQLEVVSSHGKFKSGQKSPYRPGAKSILVPLPSTRTPFSSLPNRQDRYDSSHGDMKKAIFL